MITLLLILIFNTERWFYQNVFCPHPVDYHLDVGGPGETTATVCTQCEKLIELYGNKANTRALRPDIDYTQPY